MSGDPIGVDCLLPPEIAKRAETLGAHKCRMRFAPLFALAVLAGAFIALGAIFATTTAAGGAALPFGVLRVLVGLTFCLGLILVVAGGAELFTGNNLIVMAWANRRVTTRALLRNWGIVYVGNAVGALGTVTLMIAAQQHEFGSGSVGHTALRIAHGKLQFTFVQAIALGILCNALVCLAVWIAMGARTLSGRILAVLFPVTAFVAAGFEHSIANLYFVPYALAIDAVDPAFVAASGIDYTGISWGTFLTRNLLPVTIGNIIGGAVLVAAVYWFVYLRGGPSASEPHATDSQSETREVR